MAFQFSELEIPDLYLIKPDTFGDSRGYFMESYKKSVFEENLKRSLDFRQDNHSLSKKNILRGIHFQRSPSEQGKLVRVISGAVYDVAVDLRLDSPTYKKWVGAELTAENKHMLWIPEGFGHGFLTLQDDTMFVYKVTNEYNQEADGGIHFNDPDIAVTWPVSEKDVLVSDKDKTLPLLREVNLDFRLKRD